MDMSKVARLNDAIMELEMEICISTKDEVKKNALIAIEALQNIVKDCDACKPRVFDSYVESCCDDFLNGLLNKVQEGEY